MSYHCQMCKHYHILTDYVDNYPICLKDNKICLIDCGVVCDDFENKNDEL